MTSYTFITRRNRNVTDLHDDLTARRYAKLNSDCLRVETDTGRVVWRKPLSDMEMKEHARRDRAG